jgi:hypothetical protein
LRFSLVDSRNLLAKSVALDNSNLTRLDALDAAPAFAALILIRVRNGMNNPVPAGDTFDAIGGGFQIA